MGMFCFFVATIKNKKENKPTKRTEDKGDNSTFISLFLYPNLLTFYIKLIPCTPTTITLYLSDNTFI